MDGTCRNDIKPGTRVLVVQKQDQRTGIMIPENKTDKTAKIS